MRSFFCCFVQINTTLVFAWFQPEVPETSTWVGWESALRWGEANVARTWRAWEQPYGISTMVCLHCGQKRCLGYGNLLPWCSSSAWESWTSISKDRHCTNPSWLLGFANSEVCCSIHATCIQMHQPLLQPPVLLAVKIQAVRPRQAHKHT